MAKPKLTAEEQARKDKVSGHCRVYRTWGRMSTWMTWLHYILGTLSVIFTTVSAAAISTKYSEMREVFLVCAAVLTSLIVFYKPSERADRYRLAWATLGNAIDRYVYRPLPDEEELMTGVWNACLWGDSVVRYNSPMPFDDGQKGEKPKPENKTDDPSKPGASSNDDTGPKTEGL